MTYNNYKAMAVDLESKFGENELVLFLFEGNLIHGTVVGAEYSELNYEFLYTLEFEDMYGDGGIYSINISESQLVTPPNFLNPSDEDFICDGCMEQILENLSPDGFLLDTENKTSGNCYYTIFPDDQEEAVHIEIKPDWLWTADDIWEMIDDLAEWATLLEQVPEVDFFGEVGEIGQDDETNLTVNLNLDTTDFNNKIEEVKQSIIELENDFYFGILNLKEEMANAGGFLKFETETSDDNSENKVTASVRSSAGDAVFTFTDGIFSVSSPELILNEKSIDTEKTVLVINMPYGVSISPTRYNEIKEKAEACLKEAKINGSVLILEECINASFLKSY